MASTNNLYCLSSPMDEQKTENLWSECFQDLGSWCHQPQDELNTPNINNQNEFNFSFDDQSMYYQWDASSSIDLKSDMWKAQSDTDLPSLHFPSEEDNNNSLMTETMMTEGRRDTGIRYSGNVLLAQCPIDDTVDKYSIKPSDNIKHSNLADTSLKVDVDRDQNTLMSPNTVLHKYKNDPVKVDRSKPQPTVNRTKPCLKLNIAAASKPTAPVDTYNLDTPEVVKSFYGSGLEFNLLSFINGNNNEATNSKGDPPATTELLKDSLCCPEQIMKIDHDYTGLPSSDKLKFQNLEPMKEEPSYQVSQFFKEDVKDRFFPVNVKEEPSSPVKRSSNLGKRVRKSVAEHSDDYIFDEDPPSDHSEDWSPVKKKTKNSKTKGDTVNKRRTSSVSDCSSIFDCSSVTSGPDRYRELRDKNNEASRRSRQNRKQREVEMIDQMNELTRKNVMFRKKAIFLEERVKQLRKIMLQVVQAKSK